LCSPLLGWYRPTRQDGLLMISLLAAPTNLGLRPPVPNSVPGCAKAPEALREVGLHDRLIATGASDAGVVLPGRYVDDWSASLAAGRVRNQEALVDHATRLAARIGSLLDCGAAPLILGGDCSVLVGVGVALSQRGRYGLLHVDGHTDFRHPGNSDNWASVAGEDLAAAIGQHIPEVADIGGLAPYFDAQDVAHIGCRDDDEGLDEARTALAEVIPASQWGRDPAAALVDVKRILHAERLDGYWLHVDVDVLDPSVMPAVDSPDAGGVNISDLTTLLHELAGQAAGAHVCIFDPDLDPDASYARILAAAIVDGLGDLASNPSQRSVS
jgi:arginase